MKDDLTPSMRQRLEKWRKNTLPVKSAEIFKQKFQSKFRPVRRDHGDDIRHLDPKNQREK